MTLALVLGMVPSAVFAQDEEDGAAISDVQIVDQTVDAEGVHTQYRIEVAKDAFLSSRNPNTNYGGLSTLELGWVAGVYDASRILVEFNINQIPANASIDRAELYIYQSATRPFGDFPMTFRAQYMQQPWGEGDVVWNNANYLGGDALPLGDVQGSTGWKVTDITDLVRVWYSGGRPNYGLILTGDETSSLNRSRQFLSKERAGFQPYVLVDFTTTCDTLAPVVSTTSLPVYSPGKFPVEWSGVDLAPSGCDPTGILHYDVDFRVNGGSWQSWKNQTEATRNTFKDWAENGDFVEFRARGTDRAGNVQDFGEPQASTRIDKLPPVASMTPLPEYSTSTVIQLSWTGTDNLSGIATYDVQWREAGGEWQWLLEETTLTSYTVTGAQSGVEYELRARATDNVDNAQEWSDLPQASTTVVLQPVGRILPFQPPIIKPTASVTESFTVQWTGFFAPGTSIQQYEIYYQYDGGTWTLWRTVPGTQTSAEFDYLQMGLGDGLYGFEAVATNNLGAKEERTGIPEATIIVDLADAIQPRLWLSRLYGIGVAR